MIILALENILQPAKNVFIAPKNVLADFEGVLPGDCEIGRNSTVVFGG